MKKTAVEKILKELNKLDEYYYPAGEYSLFILPNGRMVGMEGIMSHQVMLGKILKRKNINNDECIKILADIKCVKVIVSHQTSLTVDVITPPTREQKATLEGLGMCSTYDKISVDTMREFFPDAPSINYCRRLLQLPLEY